MNRNRYAVIEYAIKVACPCCGKVSYKDLPSPAGRLWCQYCGRTRHETEWKRK